MIPNPGGKVAQYPGIVCTQFTQNAHKKAHVNWDIWPNTPYKVYSNKVEECILWRYYYKKEF